MLVPARSCTFKHWNIRTRLAELHFAKVDVAGSNPVSRSIVSRSSKIGVLLCFDAVQAGLGRTGAMFAWRHEGARPDVSTGREHADRGEIVRDLARERRCD